MALTAAPPTLTEVGALVADLENDYARSRRFLAELEAGLAASRAAAAAAAAVEPPPTRPPPEANRPAPPVAAEEAKSRRLATVVKSWFTKHKANKASKAATNADVETNDDGSDVPAQAVVRLRAPSVVQLGYDVTRAEAVGGLGATPLSRTTSTAATERTSSLSSSRRASFSRPHPGCLSPTPAPSGPLAANSSGGGGASPAGTSFTSQRRMSCGQVSMPRRATSNQGSGDALVQRASVGSLHALPILRTSSVTEQQVVGSPPATALASRRLSRMCLDLEGSEAWREAVAGGGGHQVQVPASTSSCRNMSAAVHPAGLERGASSTAAAALTTFSSCKSFSSHSRRISMQDGLDVPSLASAGPGNTRPGGPPGQGVLATTQAGRMLDRRRSLRLSTEADARQGLAPPSGSFGGTMHIV